MPTIKRKDSQLKDDVVKDQRTRVQEAINIYKQLNDLGISEDVCSGIKDFKIVMNDFVKFGYNASGKIKLPEINRQLVYVLSVQPHIVSSASLKFWAADRRSLG